jgi:hypothetical protein
MSRETAWWEMSHWAGTLKQLEAAARIAEREVQARVPFPEGYDPDAPGFDAEKHEAYLEARSAHVISVTIVEKDGYTSHLDSLDEMVERPAHTLDQITAIAIDIGRGTPSAEIRLRRNNGLAVEVVGYDRNWVAGLRQQLEAALRPIRRLHAPFGSEPINFALPGMIGFLAVFIGIDQALYYAAHWSTKTGRVLVSLGLGVVWAATCGALAWASAKRSEVLPEDGLPRYERWRGRVLGSTGAVILAVIGTALYSLISG